MQLSKAKHQADSSLILSRLSVIALFLLGVTADALAFEGKYGIKTPKAYEGPCPTTLIFEAEFTSNKPTEVEIFWTRSDGVKTETERLILEETRPNTYYASSKLEWEVEAGGSKGKSFSVRVTPSTDPQGANSRPVRVLCEGSSVTTAPDSTVESSTTASGSNPDQWELGEDEDTIVLGELESGTTDTTDTVDALPASQENIREITAPQTFRCPAEVEIGAKPVPSGWRSSWNRQVVSFATQTVSNDKMVCLYQKGRVLIPINIPIPQKAKTCSPSGRGFVCTMYK